MPIRSTIGDGMDVKLQWVGGLLLVQLHKGGVSIALGMSRQEAEQFAEQLNAMLQPKKSDQPPTIVQFPGKA